MKIAILDDEKFFRDQLQTLLSQQLDLLGDTRHTIDVFDNGETFLNTWKAGKYDLILLDIYMQELTGVDVASIIRKTDSQVSLVFCTSSNEYASETYAVGAKEYLQKPITAEKISIMFQKLNLEKMELLRTIRLPDGYPLILRNILYLEYSNHVVTIYTKKGDAHRIRLSFGEMETLLASYNYFYSPIKGMILNFHEVIRKSEDTFYLTNGVSIPITRRKIKDAQEVYSQFLFQKMLKEVDV